MNAASAGKWAAVALFSFVAVLVVIAALAEMGRQADAKRAGGPKPVDYPFGLEVTGGSAIQETEFVDPGTLTDGTGAIASVDDWNWTNVDPETGRVTYKITAEHVDPESGGRVSMTKPTALVYLENQTARITATEGELVLPPGQNEPESGKLSGGVVIEIFEIGEEAPPGEPTLDSMTPSGVLKTESLFFETVLGQIETPDAVTYESEGLSFAGRGVLIRVGELEKGSEYRLNMVRIEQSSGLRIRPGTFGSKEKRATNREPSEPPTPSDTANTEVIPDYYRATMLGGIEIEQAGRTITAERFDAFARLFGGKLADNAVASLAMPDRREPDVIETTRSDSDSWSSSFSSTPEETLAEEDALGRADEEIVITWGGALEIRPEATEPAELARDDVFIRFSAPPEASVEIADADTGANARCATLMYGLTSARLLMIGAGLEAAGVRLSAPGSGEVTGNSLEIELADLPRGVVRMRSGGTARAVSERERRISWTDLAEIGFELVREDEGAGPIQVLARSVSLSGGIDAVEAGNTVNASSALATFRDATSPDGARVSELASLSLQGEVRATTEDGGSLGADQTEIQFETQPGTTQSMPVSAKARGAVRVARRGDWLEGEHLDTWFTTDEKGKLRVSRLEGATGVALGTERGFGATTELLKADLDTERYELAGDSTEVFHVDGHTRYGLSSPSMRIDARARTLVSFGRGEATYSMTPLDGVGDSGRLTWTGSMFYDDFAGTADIGGDVIASRVPGPLERQHAEAERLQLRITPWTDTGEDSERRVLALDIEGSPDNQALMELRRYGESAGPASAELETLVALRSAFIGFDAVAEVLDVPQSGLLLVEDRRKGEVRPGESANAVTGDTEVRGTTAFQWEDSLRFERPTGFATMKREVQVRHLGLETGRLTQLECETLDAQFQMPGMETIGQSPLLGVKARDGVYLRHDTLEVICDGLDFDAFSEQVEANANAGNRVTVRDSGDGRHFTATSILVDLRTGEWRAQKATGIRISE